MRRSLALAVGLAMAAPARADGPAVAADPPRLIERPLVLAREAVEVAVSLELNLAPRRLGEPASIAPDAWVGATDRLTVGVVHSARALGLVDAGLGLCFTGSAHGCPRAYDNVGLDARYDLTGGRLAVAARTRLVASSFDPFKPSLRVGALVRARHAWFAAIADPQVQIGLANRDLGNRDWIRVPLWLAAEPWSGTLVALRTGVDGEVATFGETFAIPLGLDAVVRIGRYELALMVGFPQLGGPQNQVKSRSMALTLTGRWP